MDEKNVQICFISLFHVKLINYVNLHLYNICDMLFRRRFIRK